MAHLEAATEFVLGIISQNEGMENPSNDFVTASMTWIRSSFLTDDPITSTILENKDLPEMVKKTVLEAKLKTLENNPYFTKALNEKLQAFLHYKAHLKKVFDSSEMGVKGNTNSEDNAHPPSDNYDEIQSRSLKASEDFGLHVDTLQGSRNAPINNSRYHNNTYSSGEKAPPQYQSIKSDLKNLLLKGNTAVVIQSLLDAPDNKNEDVYNTILILSAKLNRVLEQKKKGNIGADETAIERNKINGALTMLIDDFYY